MIDEAPRARWAAVAERYGSGWSQADAPDPDPGRAEAVRALLRGRRLRRGPPRDAAPDGSAFAVPCGLVVGVREEPT